VLNWRARKVQPNEMENKSYWVDTATLREAGYDQGGRDDCHKRTDTTIRAALDVGFDKWVKAREDTEGLNVQRTAQTGMEVWDQLASAECQKIPLARAET
jgi:hypothetical protein